MSVLALGAWNHISASIGSSGGSAGSCGSAMGSTRAIDGKGSSRAIGKLGNPNGGVDAFGPDKYVLGISSGLSCFLGCRSLRDRRLNTQGTRLSKQVEQSI
ncbi:uncharacterized protein N7500_008732 [Penicillium coprophilum]|uniref:uncharacterized protein n=1 Tax=Penicillium coprophilum TaxID=36646 RepID=UPI002395A0D7|nr:uncharacterized protein N7500_008732 [Penicillium coprophilum]KAJ5159081.1 hypothetical protein N7500_008732 [Penicillium coprophilum]